MYIPKGYDENPPEKSGAIPSLFDHITGQYRTISATWPNRCGVDLMVGDMAIVLKVHDRPNNNDMHQDYE